MRIVNAATFLAMPAGTVFSKFRPSTFGELMIKGDTSQVCDDFYYTSPTDEVDCSGSSERDEILEAAEEKGAAFSLHFHTESRDALYDTDQLYAVWDREDVEGLIGRLQQALQDGYPEALPTDDA